MLNILHGMSEAHYKAITLCYFIKDLFYFAYSKNCIWFVQVSYWSSGFWVSWKTLINKKTNKVCSLIDLVLVNSVTASVVGRWRKTSIMPGPPNNLGVVRIRILKIFVQLLLFWKRYYCVPYIIYLLPICPSTHLYDYK